MRYKWSQRKFWKSWIRHDIKKWYYKRFHGFDMGMHGTLLPSTGKGRYVSVFVKGKIIQIVDERGENDEIRIIPCQYNHGVMVEQWRDNRLYCRNHLSIKQLNKNIIFASNVEQLTKR